MKLVSVLMDEQRVETGLKCKDPSLTQQHLAEDCDINEIIRKFEKTGLVTHVQQKVAKYGDFTDVPDYQSALNTVIAAEEMFMALPAGIREAFDNDPAAMVAFVADPKNRAKALEMGLLEAVVPEGGSTPGGSGSAPEGPKAGSTEDSTPAPTPAR